VGVVLGGSPLGLLCPSGKGGFRRARDAVGKFDIPGGSPVERADNTRQTVFLGHFDLVVRNVTGNCKDKTCLCGAVLLDVVRERCRFGVDDGLNQGTRRDLFDRVLKCRIDLSRGISHEVNLLDFVVYNRIRIFLHSSFLSFIF